MGFMTSDSSSDYFVNSASPSHSSPSSTLPVLIIGGGLTGLSAAYQLEKMGTPYVLLESGSHLGGKVQSEHTKDGFLLEKAADACILGKPHAIELAQELELESEIIHPQEKTKKLYFLQNGQLLDFPANLKMFVPLDDQSFLASGVLSPAGARRFLAEQDVPPKSHTAEDESLASFVTRRFGEEALNFIAPMAAGIYVAHPDELSMQATFPQFLALEQQHGSVIRGSRATPKSTAPVFMSFRDGMATLPRAMASALTGEIRLNASVQHIQQEGVQPDGTSLDGTQPDRERARVVRVTLQDGSQLRGRGVIVAVPSWHAAPLLAEFREAANLIQALKVNSSVAVMLAYRPTSVAVPLNLHGLLVSPVENSPITAITVHSSKLHGRAPAEHVLLRVFFEDIQPKTAEDIAKTQVRQLLGIHEEPLWCTHVDWRLKNPAYQVGHVQHLARIREALPSYVQVAGASFTGVGIPDCIRAGRQAAQVFANS